MPGASLTFLVKEMLTSETVSLDQLKRREWDTARPVPSAISMFTGLSSTVDATRELRGSRTSRRNKMSSWSLLSIEYSSDISNLLSPFQPFPFVVYRTHPAVFGRGGEPSGDRTHDTRLKRPL